jgi:hypothetical protein
MLPLSEAAVWAGCCHRPVPRTALLRVLVDFAIRDRHFVSIFRLLLALFLSVQWALLLSLCSGVWVRCTWPTASSSPSGSLRSKEAAATGLSLAGHGRARERDMPSAHVSHPVSTAAGRESTAASGEPALAAFRQHLVGLPAAH